jgi:rhamnogalacturonyl hydrolase YesR
MDHAPTPLTTALRSLIARAPDLWRLDACGVTRAQTAIPALLHRQAYTPDTPYLRVLLLGGLSGLQPDVDLVLRALELYLSAGAQVAGALALSAIPCGNPDGLVAGVGPENGLGGRPAEGYAPQENFFYDVQNPERRYLWRWVGFQAPDLVLELQAGSALTWESSASAAALGAALGASEIAEGDSLLGALGTGTPNGLGTIPGLRLTTPPTQLATALVQLWHAVLPTPGWRPAPARRRLDARRARTPLDIARLLATVYGHKLDPVVYTLGMGISGRLRLARLDPAGEDPVPDIVRLVEPCVSGATPLFNAQSGPTALAGVMWGTQLAAATQDRRYADLVIEVAERYRPGAEGEAPPPSDPSFRTEDMFMNGTMLGRAFRLTGRTQYLDLLTPFLLQARIQQDDGLFWHCRSAPYYWGRGNGFAALGYSETLTSLPTDHPDFEALRRMHVRHLDALRQTQHPCGMYPQVLNVPGSYHEFTITCMLGYAMARALRRGWVDDSYRAVIDLAWQGVAERIDEQGGLVDCCTNTGVQDSLQAYIDRPAIFGRDDRGGAMALWFALEREQLARERG